MGGGGGVMSERKINYDKLSKEEIIALLQTLDKRELRSLLSKVEKRKFADFIDKFYEEEINEENLKRYVKWKCVEAPKIGAGIAVLIIIFFILSVMFIPSEASAAILILSGLCVFICAAIIGAQDFYYYLSIFSKSDPEKFSDLPQYLIGQSSLEDFYREYFQNSSERDLRILAVEAGKIYRTLEKVTIKDLEKIVAKVKAELDDFIEKAFERFLNKLEISKNEESYTNTNVIKDIPLFTLYVMDSILQTTSDRRTAAYKFYHTWQTMWKELKYKTA